MFRNYLKTTLRSLWKNKRFVIINMAGMGIALACCIVAWYNYDYAMNFDEDQENIDHIYRVNFVREYQGYRQLGGITPMPVSDLLIENLTQPDEIVRVLPTGANIRIGEELLGARIALVDSNFLDVFSLEFLYGDKTALAKKSNILISDELAIKYFGRTDVVGETLQQIYGNESEIKDYNVAGVFKKTLPNSIFYFQALTQYDNYRDITDNDPTDYRAYNTTFLLLKDPAKIAGITDHLQTYIAAQNEAREDFKMGSFYLEPLRGMAVRAGSDEVVNHWFKRAAPPPAIYAPWIMAILILLIACFNFTNTSIAMSNRRLKEIGIRKVMGGIKRQLVVQFLSENVLLCVMGLLTGLLIAEFLVPAYSDMWPFLQITYTYVGNWSFLAFLIGLVLFTGLVAGSYPAFYVSNFKPTSILKRTLNYAGTSRFTKVLLVGQYTVSVVALVMGIAFYGNAVYQKEMDYGYNEEGVIFTWVGDSKQVKLFEDALRDNVDITAMSGTKDHIFSAYYADPVRYEDRELEVDIMDISRDYLEVMDMKILEGRNFTEDSETDYMESVIVNETFVKEFGWDNALGKELVWMDSLQFYVIGVVKDFYTSGLWDKIDPMMIRYSREDTERILLVRAPADKLYDVQEYMKSQWSEVFPNRIYGGTFLDEIVAEASVVNNNIVKMFIFLGLTALVLTAIGLYSLVSLTIIKRTKEIGVRKVLGASIGQIVNTINREFIVMILVASVLGALGGYWLTGTLMKTIWYYYQDAGVMTVLVSVFAIILVSAGTVGFKVMQAATSNPVNALRSE